MSECIAGIPMHLHSKRGIRVRMSMAHAHCVRVSILGIAEHAVVIVPVHGSVIEREYMITGKETREFHRAVVHHLLDVVFAIHIHCDHAEVHDARVAIHPASLCIGCLLIEEVGM